MVNILSYLTGSRFIFIVNQVKMFFRQKRKTSNGFKAKGKPKYLIVRSYLKRIMLKTIIMNPTLEAETIKFHFIILLVNKTHNLKVFTFNERKYVYGVI